MNKTEPMKIGKNFVTEDDSDHRYRYDYLTYYTKIFGNNLKVRKYPNYKTYCPFHHDKKNPNLDINIISGRFKCFACGKKGGAWDFMVNKDETGKFIYNMPDALDNIEALRKMINYESDHEAQTGVSELTLKVEENRAKTAHNYLAQQPFAVKILTRDRGLTMETINKWNLGFMKGVITIPIKDILGNLASLKFHKKYQTEGAVNQLFPWGAVVRNREPYVIIVEGELDMIIMRQNGFNAVTQTAGANSWNNNFTQYFKRKIVYIAYDNDKPGRKGANEVGHELWHHGISTMIIQWPKFMGEKEDHIDFFVKYGKTAEDYKKIMATAQSILSLQGK